MRMMYVYIGLADLPFSIIIAFGSNWKYFIYKFYSYTTAFTFCLFQQVIVMEYCQKTSLATDRFSIASAFSF